MPLNARLQKLLDASGVDYEIIHHRQDFRARTTAADTNTPPEEFAKTVVLWIDNGYALAVLPATHYVAPSRLARAIGADHVSLASEFEMKDLLPDCEVGAAPVRRQLFLPVGDNYSCRSGFLSSSSLLQATEGHRR